MDVGDGIVGDFGIDDAVVDACIDVHRDIVLGEDELPLQVQHSALFGCYKVSKETGVRDSVQGLT